MMRRMILQVLISIVFTIGSIAPSLRADEKVRVVTTLSVLEYIAREIGGDRIIAHSLSNPKQDPHYVQPRPTLMKLAREADMFVEVGLHLELWAQKVIDGSANTAIQSGQPGRVVASDGISTLELPRVLSREWGDIHPYGNPHVWLDPVNVKTIATNIAAGLIRVDPVHVREYRQNLKSFTDRIDEALFGQELVREIGGQKLTRLVTQGKLGEYLEERGLESKLGGWLKAAGSIRGRHFVTYHKTWVYFARRFDLEIPIEIEEKPGITPSARHRDRVIQRIKTDDIRLIVLSSFYDRSAADYISRETGAAVVRLPIDLRAVEGVDTYFDLIGYYLDEIGKAYAEE